MQSTRFWWHVCIAPIGIVGNLLSLLVMSRKENHSISCSVYMRTLAITDSLVLLVSASYVFITNRVIVNATESLTVQCKIVAYSIYASGMCGVLTRGGHFLCRAVRDARLYMGYFWEIFCTFSARWVSFFKKISVFFLQGGYLFWRKILYLSNKMEPFTRNFLYFIPHSCCILHIKVLYISTWWVSFQEIYCSGWYCSGWNRLKRSCSLSQTLWLTLKVQYGFQSICKQICKQLVRSTLYISIYLLIFDQYHP